MAVLNTSSEGNSISGTKLLNGVEKSYDKGVKLLDVSEKILQNGLRFSHQESADYNKAYENNDKKKGEEIVRDAFRFT